jgi:hypothetical protein
MSNCCTECGCVLIKECDIYRYTPLKPLNNIFEKPDIIIDVHNLKVKPILGDCFQTICDKVKETPIEELNEPEKQFIEKITPFIAKWVYVFWLQRYGDGEHTEVGVVDGTYDDGVSQVSIKKLDRKINRAVADAKIYESELKKDAEIIACNKQDCDPCNKNNNFNQFNNLRKV